VPLADVYHQALALPHPANPSKLLAALDLLPSIRGKNHAWPSFSMEGWARADERIFFATGETLDISRYVTPWYRPYGHHRVPVPVPETLDETCSMIGRTQRFRDNELLTRAQARYGLHLDDTTFASFRTRMGGFEFHLPREQGDEAFTYIVQKGEQRFVVKHFSELVRSSKTGMLPYSGHAHAEAAMADQLRALLEIQDALDLIGEKRVRITKIFAVGKDYYVREYVPYTNLASCRKQIGELKRLFQGARTRGEHLGFSLLSYLMRVVEEINVNVGYLKVPNIGRQLVIYDAI
jgi:hypothetical protein